MSHRGGMDYEPEEERNARQAEDFERWASEASGAWPQELPDPRTMPARGPLPRNDEGLPYLPDELRGPRLAPANQAPMDRTVPQSIEQTPDLDPVVADGLIRYLLLRRARRGMA